MKPLKRMTIFVALSLAALPVGQAASAEAELETARTREVVISATKTEREKFEVPNSVSTVTDKEIARNQAITIADQLRDIPGIEVADGGMGGGAKRISIRGEAPSRVLILIDGMKVSEQKSMDGSMIMIDPMNVERIEVIKGPASVLYGSEAIGGVVNIITKKGGDRPVQGGVALTYDGSYDAWTPFATLFGRVGGFGYRVSGDYTDSGNKRAASGTIPNSSFEKRNISAYLDYNWDSAKVAFGFDQYWNDIEIPSTVTPDYTISMGLPRWSRNRYYTQFQVSDISSSLQQVTATASVQQTVKEFWNQIDAQASSTMTVRVSPDTRNDQDYYNANLQSDWTFGDSHYVIFGLDAGYDNLDATSDTVTTMFMGSTPISTTESHYRYKGNQLSLAAFAQDEWSITDDWAATFGLRGTWVRSELDETNDPALQTGSNHDANMVGSLGIVYSGFENLRLRANIGQGYKYPLLNQLYIGTMHGSSGVTYPNADLDPERAWSGEVGMRYENHGFNADLAAYYTRAKDYITTRTYTGPGAGANDLIFSNVNKAHTMGVELELSWLHEATGLQPYTNGAYIRREFDYGSESSLGKTTKTGLSPLTGKTGLKFERALNDYVSLHTDANVRYGTRAKDKTETGIDENPGWMTVNFSIGTELGKDKNYFVDLQLNNILDKEYHTSLSSLEEAGFHAVVRFGAEF